MWSELIGDDKGASEFEQADVIDVVVLLIVLSQRVVLRERERAMTAFKYHIKNIYLLETVVRSSVSSGVLHGAR